jgi:uncharacterized membrane protein
VKIGSISFGCSFVAGKSRVPNPAAGMITFRINEDLLTQLYLNPYILNMLGIFRLVLAWSVVVCVFDCFFVLGLGIFAGCGFLRFFSACFEVFLVLCFVSLHVLGLD